MRNLRTLLPITLLLVATALLSPASAALPAIDVHELRHELIRAPAEYLVTADNTLELAQVRDRAFQPLNDSGVNQGISGQTFRVHFRLSNEAGAGPVRWVLHGEISYMDNITAYTSSNIRLSTTARSSGTP